MVASARRPSAAAGGAAGLPAGRVPLTACSRCTEPSEWYAAGTLAWMWMAHGEEDEDEVDDAVRCLAAPPATAPGDEWPEAEPAARRSADRAPRAPALSTEAIACACLRKE